MNKLAIIAAIFLTVSTFSLSVYAMGGGMGGGMGGEMSGGRKGNGMGSNFGSDLLDWLQKWRNGSEYGHSPSQERKQMEELEQQHYEDSAYLKYQIQMKEKGLDAFLKSKDPDIEKIRAIRRDVRELRSLAEQEQRNYELEVGKMNPGYRSSNGDGQDSYESPSRPRKGAMVFGGAMRGHGKGR
jgi:hypothetical protein